MDLKLNLDTNIQEVISASVFAALGKDSRETIMKASVNYLLAHQQSSYGRRDSPLMEAVHEALRRTAEDMVKDMLETDDGLRVKVHGMVAEALDRATGEKRVAIIEKMANALGDAFNERR